MLALAAALLLFISPSLAVSGVVVLLIAFLAMDGALKVGQAVLGIGSIIRLVTLVNGASSLLLTLLSWILQPQAGARSLRRPRIQRMSILRKLPTYIQT